MRAGVLTLVDCAGSERKEDSESHNTARVKESAEINASLHALKECMRAVQRGRNKDADEAIHVPYRTNNLTKVLHESFVSPHALLAVIATVAPTATDTEHSICTLKTVVTIAGDYDEQGMTEEQRDVDLVGDGAEAVEVHPSKWDHEGLVDWLAGGRFAKYFGLVENDAENVNNAQHGSPARMPLRQRAPVAALVKPLSGAKSKPTPKCTLPSAMDGKQLCRWTEAKFTTVLCDNNAKLGRALHNAFRAELTKAEEQASRKRQQKKNSRLSIS